MKTNQKKRIIIILDGLGDRPCKQLKGKTPLEYARTPNLDWLASQSSCGLMWPIRGIAPESGASQFVMLGQPLSKYPGRGPVEAFGAGLKIKPGHVYFRCNFAKLKGKKIVDIREKIPSPNLIRQINSIDPDIRLVPTVEYRAVLEVKGISTNVSNTHPGYVRFKNYSKAVARKKIERICKGNKKSCRKLNAFINEVEKILGNRTILLRGAGNKLPPVVKMKSWTFIGDMPIEYGLAKLFGMKILKRQKDEISQILKSQDSIYCQIKGPDIPGHEGQPFRKAKAIEKIDKSFIDIIKAIKLNKLNAVLCITADHATPCSLMRHSADSVPCLIYGKAKKDKVKSFSEKDCAKGFRLEGRKLMSVLR